MDGIEPVHESVEDYFTELEKENNIYLGGDVDKTDPQELIKEAREIEDEEVDNINHLIFSVCEFEDRRKRRFS
jgi:hypothetical protein